MAEYATELVEKVHQPPLVQDCTTPAIADDDDAPEGHVVTDVGEPNDGDVPTWVLASRKYFPQAPASFVPTLIPSGTTFTVPTNKQALWAVPIVVEGTMIVDGILVSV